MSRKFKIIALFIIIPSAVIAALYIYLLTKLPDLDGKIATPKISSEARVIRDNWGVPHIYAASARDAYYAYGYAIAQDRLFQMELHRRLSKGELSEVFGQSMLKYDRMFRTYLFKRTAEKYLSRPDMINKEALEIIDSYIDGVNAFIDEDNLPVEFLLLGFKPQKFSRLDLLSMMGYMAYSFTDAIKTETLYTAFSKKLPGVNIKTLFPDYTLEKPVTVIDSQAYYNDDSKAFLHDTSGKIAASNPFEFIKDRIFSILADNRAVDMPQAAGMLNGSNSWVVAPSRSESGKAIACNDPHILLSNPSVWYEAHIKYGEYENYGYHLPMMPFPMIGHNRHKAWTMTMFENDDIDLYFEKFSPDKKLVMHKGRWVKAETFNEKIKVKGGPDFDLAITITPHGPVISDLFEGYDGGPVSMYWVFHHAENRMLNFAHEITSSKTVDEFRRASLLLAAPGLNLSYADSKGNIAWFTAGRIPVRPLHVNPKRILDGSSGMDDISGYIPPEKNPHLINPKSGIIISANNKSMNGPIGPMPDLQGYWLPTDRASRITEILSSKLKWNREEMKEIQTEVVSADTARIKDKILEAIKESKRNLNSLESEALGYFKEWSYVSDIDSVGASIYHVTMYHILRSALRDLIGEKDLEIYGETYSYWSFLKHIISDKNSRFWSDIKKYKDVSREEIIAAGFCNAVSELEKRIGGKVSGWKWGSLHKIEYVHPVGTVKPLNLLFNIGPYPAPGEDHLINCMASHFGKHDYMVYSVPSTRRIIDFGDLSKSYSILPTGNSGNFMSPHYSDQVKIYLNGEYRVINFTDEQIKASKKHLLIFTPAAQPKK